MFEVAREINHSGNANKIVVPSDSDVMSTKAAEVLCGVAVSEELLPSPRRVYWEYCIAVVKLCNGNLSEAARRMGIARRSLQRIVADKRAPLR